MAQLLFAPKIFFGSLNRRMTEKELDLLQFSSRQMAESCTCSAQIVRSKALDSGLASRRFHDMPDCFRRDPFSPHLPQSVHSAKDWTTVGTGRISSVVHGALRPAGTGTVRICFPLPIKSARTQWSSQSWKSSFFNPTSSARRSPHPINSARIARSRLPRASLPPALAADLWPRQR